MQTSAWESVGAFAVRTGALLLTVGLASASQPEKPQTEPVAAVRNDLYGDPLPDGALARFGSARLRHAGIHQVVFSADGKSLASTGNDNVVRRWEVSSGKLLNAQPFKLPPYEHQSVTSFLSPDGKTLASVGQHTLYFFDALTGTEKRRLPITDPNGGGGGAGGGLFLAPEFNEGVGFTADGKRFAITSYQHGLRLFEVASGKRVPIGGSRDNVGGWQVVAMDCAGKQWALYEKDSGVMLRELSGGKLRHKIALDEDAIELLFSPDGTKLLITTSKKLSLWNCETGAKEGEFALPSGLYEPPHYLTPHFCFSADGAHLAGCLPDEILLLDSSPLKETRRLGKKECRRCQFSPDGKTLAGLAVNTIHLWNVADGKPLHDFAGQDQAWGVVYSPDGKSIASGGGDRICVWDAATTKLRNTIRKDVSGGASIFSKDGQTLYADVGLGTVKAWRIADGKELVTFLTADSEKERGNQGVTSFHLSPDGKRLMACSSELALVVNEYKLIVYLVAWDAQTGKRLDRTSWDGLGEFSPRGTFLAVRKEGGLTLYDLVTKQERVVGNPPISGQYVFSADESLLVMPFSLSGSPFTSLEDVYAKVVETATGKVRFTLPKGSGALDAFSPDGRYLLTTGLKEFRLWEIATGQEVLRQRVDEAASGREGATFAYKAAVAPDGRSVATTMPNGNIIIWDLQPSSRLHGDLTVKDLEALWADLAGDDAAKAYSARGRFIGVAPETASVFLDQRLRPSADRTERIRGLIETLNDDDFTKRDAASNELKQFGQLAEAELRQRLSDKPAAETRSRVETLLDDMRIVRSAEERRQMRAVWILEQIGSAEARKTLKQLADGAASARQTREAKSALQRLKAKE